MTSAPDAVIRPITRPELDLPLQWAADEGWNPGLDDADAFHAADPNGFFMAFLDGEPVASISVVRYDGTFGFLGLYIVRPGYRGRGYGIGLWQAGMRYLEGCVVGLDGVVAQQASYARSGFAFAHRNVRYGGEPKGAPSAPDPRVERIGPQLVAAVIDYDRRFFPAGRSAFLRSWLGSWLDPDRRRAFAFVDAGRLRGYGVLRACRTGFKIGPLFADTPAIAEVLFQAVAAEAAGAPIFVDVPEPNAAAAALASRLGLAPIFETARMYRGPAPELPLDGIFGITSLELG